MSSDTLTTNRVECEKSPNASCSARFSCSS